MKKLSALLFLVLGCMQSYAQQYKASKGPEYYGSLVLDPKDSVRQGQLLKIAFSVTYEDFDGNKLTSPPGTLRIDFDDQYVVRESNSVSIPGQYTDTITLSVALPQGIYSVHLRFGGQLLATGKVTILPNNDNPPTEVWPGDANGDGQVNLYDPLAIAVAYNCNGLARTDQSITWQKHYCNEWPQSFLTGDNYNNADCNGDGTISWQDIPAISANYTKLHSVGTTTVNAQPGDPLLYFDLSGIIFQAGNKITVPLKFVGAKALSKDIYGIAMNITIDGCLPKINPTFRFDKSIVGNMLNYINYLSASDIDLVTARNDHRNTRGEGIIATMDMTIPDDVTNESFIAFHLRGTRLINKDGKELAGYNVRDDTAYISSASVPNAPNNTRDPVILPNPSFKGAKLAIAFPSAMQLQMVITGLDGKLVHQQELNFPSGQHLIDLPALAPGNYIVTLLNAGQGYKKVIKWTQE